MSLVEIGVELACLREETCRQLITIIRLKAILSRARTRTRPDGSGCWCDEDELRNEQNASRDTGSEYPEHTVLCREITEALR